jgi:hypothetical protein
LFERDSKPFTLVDPADINFMVPDNNAKVKGFKTQDPNTPKSCFHSAKKKNGSKPAVVFEQTPNIPAVSNKKVQLTKINKNQDQSHTNIVTPHNGEMIVAYEKYIAHVPGPSDILKYLNNLNTKTSRDKKSAKEKEEEREINQKHQEII